MRYTEARLEKLTQDVFLEDLDKNVVDFMPNFDETEKEPVVLPVRIPNLLVNGADGIAVGMATSIPPHNLGEVVDAVKAYMKNNDISVKGLMRYLKGPDFPTGGLVVNKDDLLKIYETGTGKLRVRGKVETVKLKGGRQQLVITEIPYTMIGANIGKFLNDIASLVENKKTTDIVDISNQSSKEGIRIVLDLKRDADVENLTNMLYKKTKLEDTFGVNMLAVADGRPETLSLKQIIEHHVNFIFDINNRKYTTLLNKEQEKKEMELLAKHKVNFIVLARYMQVISERMVDPDSNLIINLHHSFLPAFVGAKPYHAAFERGVKIIGATSHYVTTELDAGPIIEQDVVRITHKDSIEDLVNKGKDLEKIVLSRAVQKHIERKVLAYKNKTVIFN